MDTRAFGARTWQMNDAERENADTRQQKDWKTCSMRPHADRRGPRGEEVEVTRGHLGSELLEGRDVVQHEEPAAVRRDHEVVLALRLADMACHLGGDCEATGDWKAASFAEVVLNVHNHQCVLHAWRVLVPTGLMASFVIVTGQQNRHQREVTQ